MEMDGIDIDSLKANMHRLVVKIVQFRRYVSPRGTEFNGSSEQKIGKQILKNPLPPSPVIREHGVKSKPNWYNVNSSSHSVAACTYRAGGTGPAAPVLAGPIFEAPTIFLAKTKK